NSSSGLNHEKQMSRYKIQNQEGIYFVTLTIVDWVDIFIRKRYKDIIVESLDYCQRKKGLTVFAYVIMSSHLHLIVKAEVGLRLSDILRDFKKFTAQRILNEIEKGGYESRRAWLLHRFAFRGKEQSNRQYQFWQPDNHPIVFITYRSLHKKLITFISIRLKKVG
ncbi:MAG: transposase, partial [Saprospiraceae bacterium]